MGSIVAIQVIIKPILLRNILFMNFQVLTAINRNIANGSL